MMEKLPQEPWHNQNYKLKLVMELVSINELQEAHGCWRLSLGIMCGTFRNRR